MKIEKAIEDLKNINIIQKQRHMCKALDGEVTTKEIEDYRSRFASVNLAISALVKQIPKKPIMKPWSISKCPSCNTDLGEWLEDGYHNDWDNLKVCNCGQKLDWEVEDE